MQHEAFFRKELVIELRKVADMMAKEKNPEKKLYYFSAAFGITSRTYRYVFSSDVLLADLVLTAGYQQLLERIHACKAGDISVLLTEEIFEKLEQGLWDLAQAFEEGRSILEPLEKINTITFSVTGPGYYLKEKGMIKL
jgi:hypothetical protein